MEDRDGTEQVRVSLANNSILTKGVAVEIGQLVGQSLDGLDFIYIANSDKPSEPLIAMSLDVASLAIFSVSLAMIEITQNRDEVLLEKLIRLQAIADDVAGYFYEQQKAVEGDDLVDPT